MTGLTMKHVWKTAQHKARQEIKEHCIFLVQSKGKEGRRLPTKASYYLQQLQEGGTFFNSLTLKGK